MPGTQPVREKLSRIQFSQRVCVNVVCVRWMCMCVLCLVNVGCMCCVFCVRLCVLRVVCIVCVCTQVCRSHPADTGGTPQKIRFGCRDGLCHPGRQGRFITQINESLRRKGQHHSRSTVRGLPRGLLWSGVGVPRGFPKASRASHGLSPLLSLTERALGTDRGEGPGEDRRCRHTQ